jgi:hypothetical protein
LYKISKINGLVFLQIFSEFCERLTKLLVKERNQELGRDDTIQLKSLGHPKDGNLEEDDDLDDDSFMKMAHEGLYSKSREADV